MFSILLNLLVCLDECSDNTCFGCNGGMTTHAYEYVKTAGGMQKERKYPYTAMDGDTGSCAVDEDKGKHDFVVTEFVLHESHTHR